MNLYRIRKGTVGKLINQTGKSAKIVEWTTRKDLEFSDFIIDPIWYHNNRAANMPSQFTTLAQQGYAVYGGKDGGEVAADYLLVVPYNQVEII